MSFRIILVLTACAAFVASGADAAPRRPVHHGAQPASTGPAPEAQSATSAISQGAVAIVNDQIISDYDLSQRIALFYVTSGVRPSAENAAFVRGQVLRSLEDEMLEVKEASSRGVTVNKEEIDQALNGIATDNGTSVAEIETTLGRGGVTMQTFRNQILAQIAWNKVVQGRFSARLDIREEEVTAAIDRIKLGSSKPQFHILEIYLAVDHPEDDSKVLASAQQLIDQIKAGAVFNNIARQFSQSPSAANGGDIGWVQEGQLADELDKVLPGLKRGGVSAPIRSSGGYYVLMLRGRVEPAGTPVPVAAKGPPTGPVPLARFLVPVPEHPPAGYIEKAANFAAQIAHGAQTCADLQSVAGRMHLVYMSLGTINPKSLSVEVQAALAKTDPGGITEPFRSAAGIEIFARCEPRPEKIETVTIPTPDAMKNAIFQQRVGMLARSYLRDLRRDAVIETR